MVRLVFSLLLLPGCGGDEAPSCSTTNVPLSITVDGRPVQTCGSFGWELRVRACGLQGAGCACGECAGAEPIDRACEGPDACEQSSIDLAAGDYRVCVEAILVNGSLAFESCEDVTTGSDSIAVAVETGDAFPCIRDWVYDGATCCNDVVGACDPP